ncbi:MAG: NAD(P)/FAD-dependent oxidoreductase [Peptostreptococcaceae bacterium]|nr:NAD(P)/FAD-dependent oxidoreductase [Peptostreptococcaceae bacterium]
MKNIFDLIVIGAGAAGMGAAMKCKKGGLDVAIVDSRPFGGTCALRGCDPKKILVGAAELMDWNQRMKGKGFDAAGEINWTDLMAFKRTFTEGVPENREKSLQDAGITILHGHAKFIEENKIQVEDQIYEAKYIVIATGSIPMPLPFKGNEHVIDSEAFLELEKLPKKIVFVGGGFIAFEFAHIAARTGAEVHIIETQDRPLANFDQDIVKMLLEKSKKIGIQVHTGTSVDSVEKNDEGFIVNCVANKEKVEITGGLVVNGAGRIANIAGLNLEAGKVEHINKGILVNEYLQNISNFSVYATGDAVISHGLPLTPIAVNEGKMAAANILKGNVVTPDYKVLPTVVFTVPKIGSVGLTEAQVIEKDYIYEIINVDMSDWYTYKRTNDSFAMAKVIVDKETDLILGAHIMGSYADELINHFALAIQYSISAKELKRLIYAYPSAASDIGYMLP